MGTQTLSHFISMIAYIDCVHKTNNLPLNEEGGMCILAAVGTSRRQESHCVVALRVVFFLVDACAELRGRVGWGEE